MGSNRIRGLSERGASSPLLLIMGAGVVALVLALALAACGGQQSTTTIPQPGETTTTAPAGGTATTALPGGLTTSTEAAAAGTTTTAVAQETTTSSLETTTTEKLSTAEQRLANGDIKAMGYIKKVWEQDGKRYISIDYAEMLTGDAAVQAAIAAGEIQPGEDLPNDYYIKNTNPELRQFEVSGSVAITTSTWKGQMNMPVSWNVFTSFWSANPPDSEAALLRDSPWWIERNGPIVIKIDEQYLP